MKLEEFTNKYGIIPRPILEGIINNHKVSVRLLPNQIEWEWTDHFTGRKYHTWRTAEMA